MVVTESDVAEGLTMEYDIPGTSWDDVAMLGCNLNQPAGGEEGTAGDWDPAGTSGICIIGTGFDRIHIQTANGTTDPDERWCAPAPCADWSDFNTQCWHGTGLTYDMRPIQMASSIRPSVSDGVDVAVTPISGTICVREIYVY